MGMGHLPPAQPQRRQSPLARMEGLRSNQPRIPPHLMLVLPVQGNLVPAVIPHRQLLLALMVPLQPAQYSRIGRNSA